MTENLLSQLVIIFPSQYFDPEHLTWQAYCNILRRYILVRLECAIK